ncbi:hypothetical protein PGB90_009805 [Kerria lacca]
MAVADWENANSVYDFSVNTIKGESLSLDKGHVLLIVNVASKCGLTSKNYAELVQLDEKLKDKGLRILAFPCNQFGHQEPGGAEQICEFVKKKNVTFDIFEKIDVNGNNAHPLWKFLKKKQPGTLGEYWGEELTKNSVKDSTNSLQNLLLKIEERRKRKHFCNISESDIIRNDYVEPEKINTLDKRLVKKFKVDTSSKQDTLNIADNTVNNSKSDNFTIISTLELKKNVKIKRVLPNWLKKPSLISTNLKHLNTTIHDIYDLDPSLITALQRNKITHFFPVQSQLIPYLLKYHQKCTNFWPRDICVSAPTGSGKTLAFVIPIIQILKNRIEPHIRSLVVLPTKDLSFQVYKVFQKYVIDTDLKVIHLGNLSLEKEKCRLVAYDAVYGFHSLIDIVVTTPGRLVEHLKYTPGFSLSNLKFLVIDEADHVMDSMQNDWIHHLYNFIPPFNKNLMIPYLTLSNAKEKPSRPQKLLFSATFSQDPEKLRHLNLFQPHLFTSISEFDIEKTTNEDHQKEFIGKFATPIELTEYFTICSLSAKPLVMYHIIKQNNWKHVLCFADSISNVHKLTNLLQQLSDFDEDKLKLNIVGISSKLSNCEHYEILEKFSKGHIDILISTDNLARGIDLQNVKYVILYNVPRFTKNYIHRIGRTGRAGQQGTSLVLVTSEEKDDFENILKTCGKTNVKNMSVSLIELKKLEAAYKNSLKALHENLQIEKRNTIMNMKVAKKGKVLNKKKKQRRKKIRS